MSQAQSSLVLLEHATAEQLAEALCKILVNSTHLRTNEQIISLEKKLQNAMSLIRPAQDFDASFTSPPEIQGAIDQCTEKLRIKLTITTSTTRSTSVSLRDATAEQLVDALSPMLTNGLYHLDEEWDPYHFSRDLSGRYPRPPLSYFPVGKHLQTAISWVYTAQNRYNASFPVLPEIITEIFRCFQFLSFYKSGKSAPKWYSWTVVTCVCRNWRNIALGSPSLWCDIYLRTDTSRNFIKTASERSKSMGLHVHIPPIHQLKMHDGMRRRLATGHRTVEQLQSLSIKLQDEDDVGLFEHVFSQPAHKLESLDISIIENTHAEFPPLFKLECPKLKRLILRDCHSWPSKIAHNLTSICLGGSIDPNSLAKCILNTPFLEELTLLSVQRRRSKLTADSFSSFIPLENLRLSLESTDPIFLRCFAFGRNVTLKVYRSTCVSNSLGDLRNTVLGPYHDIWGSSPLQDVEKLDLAAVERLRIGRVPAGTVTVAGHTQGTKPFEFTVRYSSRGEQIYDKDFIFVPYTISDLHPLRAIAIREITLTGFRHSWRFDEHSWRKLLVSMHNLETIVVRRSDATGIVAGLTPGRGDEVDEANHSCHKLLCPKLRTLRLVDGTDFESSKLHLALKELLEHRASRGNRLQLLQLAESFLSGLSKEVIGDLRAYVDLLDIKPPAWSVCVSSSEGSHSVV